MSDLALQDWRPQENNTVVTALGIRFFDPLRRKPITDGLNAVAFPLGSPRRGRRAVRSASGIYAFHGLPDLTAHEYPRDADQPVTSPPIEADFEIEVVDRLRRYSPISFQVTAPFTGIYPIGRPDEVNPIGLSPPTSSPQGVFLYSSSGRPAVPGLGVVRAHLIDATTGSAAAYAVLSVRLQGERWIGIADQRGCVLVEFGYPPAVSTTMTSPPSLLTPPGDQQWDVSVSVQYEPGSVRFSAANRLPDLLSLFEQASGAIRNDVASPAQPNLITTLDFGKPLVLRSQGQSELLIVPGASPP